MAKLVCKFEVEFEVNEKNKEVFEMLKLNNFKEMKDGLQETLEDNADGKVNIVEFIVTE